MTSKEFHIGFDLAIQQLNSNLFNRLEEEDRDFIINNAIFQFVNGFLDDSSNNDLNFELSKHYYSEISTLLRDDYLPIENYNDYVLCDFPYENILNSDNTIRNGDLIISGVSYKLVSDLGGVDLSPYGGVVNSPVGASFKCDLGYANYNTLNDSVEFKKGSYLCENPLSNTHKYMNLYEFNNPVDIISESTNPKYKILRSTFEDTNSSLKPLNSISNYKILNLKANIEVGNPLTNSVELELGKEYKLKFADDPIDLSTVGGYSSSIEGVVFQCNISRNFTLPDGVQLIETKTIPVELITTENAYLLNDNKYINPDYFLIAEIVNNKLKIYSDEKIVNYVKMSYVTEPIGIDVENNITSNLPIKSHNKILDLAIALSLTRYNMKNASATGQLQNQQQ